MDIGEKIRKIRKLKGYTQRELAFMSETAEITIRKYENGMSNPQIETLKRIAVALDVSVSDLMPDEWDTNLEKKDVTLTHKIEQKMNSIGYSIGAIKSEGYLWINYPDGTLEISEDELIELNKETEDFLKFKLEQLKHQHIKSFKPYKNT